MEKVGCRLNVWDIREVVGCCHDFGRMYICLLTEEDTPCRP